MKKTLFPAILLCTVSVAVLFSCSKKSNQVKTINTGARQSPNQLFAGLRSTPQTLSVTAGRDTIVFGTKGTSLHFYTYSFKTASGTTITSGTINVQLVEMYKPGDMIANRATTMVNGQLLQSGGQISITATMNGQKVYANKYGVGFIQAGQVQPMQLFQGNNNNGDSVVNWVTPDSLHANPVVADSSIVIANAYGRPWVGYVFDTASTDSSSTIQYTNCDAFYSSDSALTTVNVAFPDSSFNPNTTELFLVLPSINCAMSTIEPILGGANYDPARNTISLVSETNTAIVPAGMSYVLVVVANKNGQYYYYTQSGTIPHNGLAATAIMTVQTQSYVTTQLAAL